MADLPVIAGYKIHKAIGKGGMATVYTALDLKQKKIVAIKILHSHVEKENLAKERFLKEANLSLSLNHKCLVKTYSAGFMKNGSPYIVMQYVVGMSLQTIVRTKKTLSPKKVISIIKEISSVLVYLHDKGIVHRDIKLSNIICEKDTENIMLMDFGIARSVVDNSDLTVTGSVLGTPKFLSPEQAAGKDLTLKSDIYSLGICLFYMLTGRAPFVANTSMAMVLMHLDTPMPPLPKHYAEIQYLLEKMCHKDEQLRINAKALDRELHAILLNKKIDDWPAIKYETSKEFIDEHYRTLHQKKVDTEITQIKQQQIKKMRIPILILLSFLIVGLGYFIFSNSSQPQVFAAQKTKITFTPSKKMAKVYLDDMFIGTGKVDYFYADKASHKLIAIKKTDELNQRWYGVQNITFPTAFLAFNIDMKKQFLLDDEWVSERVYLRQLKNEQRLSYINKIEKHLMQQKFFGEYDANAFNQLESFKEDFVNDQMVVDMTDVFRLKLLSTLDIKITNNDLKSAKNLIKNIETYWYDPNIVIEAKNRIKAIEY